MRNAALVLLCTSLVWAGQKPSETLFITNVNLVDVRNGGIVPNLTVVVKDGNIDSIGKIALIDSRPGVRVVNGGGKYLIPALWDMNAQFSSGNSIWSNSTLYALY